MSILLLGYTRPFNISATDGETLKLFFSSIGQLELSNLILLSSFELLKGRKSPLKDNGMPFTLHTFVPRWH